MSLALPSYCIFYTGPNKTVHNLASEAFIVGLWLLDCDISLCDKLPFFHKEMGFWTLHEKFWLELDGLCLELDGLCLELDGLCLELDGLCLCILRVHSVGLCAFTPVHIGLTICSNKTGFSHHIEKVLSSCLFLKRYCNDFIEKALERH